MPPSDQLTPELCLPPPRPVLLSVRHIGPADRSAILAHFVGLNAGDRELRFCQQRTDAQLAAYVDGLNFARDAILGAFVEARLLGICHLGFGQQREGEKPSAELGISVAMAERGLRVGAELVNASFVAAVERGCSEVYIYYVQHNHRMHGMCVRLGASIERERGECTARIPLVPHWHGEQLIGVTAGSRHLSILKSSATL